MADKKASPKTRRCTHAGLTLVVLQELVIDGVPYVLASPDPGHHDMGNLPPVFLIPRPKED